MFKFPLFSFTSLIFFVGLFFIAIPYVSATTEFTSIVDPDNGIGTDYTSLNAWESANQVDLTVATTLVFAHGGITGTIADASSVTGLTSGATGTVTHATDTQILIHTITGTFQSGEQVYETLDTNFVTTSDAGDDAIAVASCQSSGTADTTSVTIDGWTTSATNYIKVWTDPSLGNRHDGKWDDGKYHINHNTDNASTIEIRNTAFVHIDGLQIESTSFNREYTYGIQVYWSSGTRPENIKISNCIIREVNTGYSHHRGISTSATSMAPHYFWNNIIYGFSGTNGTGISIDTDFGTAPSFIYNNTIYDSTMCFSSGSEGNSFKNNITQNCTTGFDGTFDSTSTHNITDDDAEDGAFGISADSGTTDGTTTDKLVDSTQNFTSTIEIGNIIANTTDSNYTFVTAIDSDTTLSINDDIFTTGEAYTIYTNIHGTVNFEDANNDDYHLDQTDIVAKNNGTDLSSDANLPFDDDIDGSTRDADSQGWDIGADEVVTKIYRSVGPSSTSALDDDNSNADTITITSGTATFSATVANNIGVGDVILYDSSDDNSLTSADSIAFISARTDSTHYTLQTQTGAIPSDLSVNDTWEIYRAHTSLSNAEAGTVNSTLNTLGIAYNGGNRDLVANNEQWNIACYGDAVDTTEVEIDGWTTGAQNYIKVYTPVDLMEVGESQRHDGKAGSGYILRANHAIYMTESNVWVDGLELDNNGGSSWIIDCRWASQAGTIKISNNIIHNGTSYGFFLSNSDEFLVFNVWNNIIYNFQIGIRWASSVEGSVYNNTIINNINEGISGGYHTFNFKNNISSGNGTDYDNVGNTTHSNNISSDATSPDGAGYQNKTIDFVSTISGSEDFHLASSDTSARDAGSDLSADTDLSFDDDIDGAPRNASRDAWDIGADELVMLKAKFEGMFKFEGNFKIE